ncbi:hypothetical protein ALC62_09515 [Cyphomyrmex costatus]|uniref:Uncharacterized protein n=1 Tax=Cyphomyrmex costatus TaxID=456900 RepID=A0A195CGP6_9HYME|nr:hypothetical protein ALC62_09515 [Cyphomyrmex costatus]
MCVAVVKYSANLLPTSPGEQSVATPPFPFPLTGHIIPLALVHHTLTYFCATMNQADMVVVVVVVAISVLIGNHEGLLGLPALRALSFSPQKNRYRQTVKCRNNFQTEITGRVPGYSVSDESLPARVVTKQFFHSRVCRKRWKGWR